MYITELEIIIMIYVYIPRPSEYTVTSSLSATIDIGTLGILLLSRSNANTLYSPLGRIIVKLLLALRGMGTKLKLSNTPSMIRITKTRAPGETVPSTYSILTLIQPPPGHSDTIRS